MDRLIEALSGKLLDVLLPSLVSALAAVGVALLTQMLRKVGVQLDVEQQNQIKNAARDAVLAVEEQNRRNVKGGLDPMTSKQKDTAATFIVSQTVPKADPDQVKIAIASTLPEVRAVTTPSTPVLMVGPGTVAADQRVFTKQ
jgi:hypothetical protein